MEALKLTFQTNLTLLACKKSWGESSKMKNNALPLIGSKTGYRTSNQTYDRRMGGNECSKAKGNTICAEHCAIISRSANFVPSPLSVVLSEMACLNGI